MKVIMHCFATALTVYDSRGKKEAFTKQKWL